MKKEDLYYVVAEPQHKGDFRPIVIEYGIDFNTAEKVVRKYINENGLRFKVKDERYPAFVRIMRISEKLPDKYVLITKAEVVE